MTPGLSCFLQDQIFYFEICSSTSLGVAVKSRSCKKCLETYKVTADHFQKVVQLVEYCKNPVITGFCSTLILLEDTLRNSASSCISQSFP